MGKDSLFGTIFNQVYSMIIIMQLGGIMEVKQIGMYLIIAGAVILALKFINAIISFILSDFLLGLGTLLLLACVAMLAMKFIKENRDDAKDEPFRGIDK
jgi:predicted phage tail protein